MFNATKSSYTLRNAESKIILAIRSSQDIDKAIEDVAGDLAIPHRAFMIYPGDDRRQLLDCLIKPVSEWALGKVISTLDSRGAEAAYDLYLRIEGSPRAASFRGQLWEHKVHRYFCSSDTLSFTIQSLEDSSTMEWKPFENMVTSNFGPVKRLAGHLHQCIADNKAGYFRPKSDNFASFDAIIYQPNKPLVGAQVTENHDHPLNTRGPILLRTPGGTGRLLITD